MIAASSFAQSCTVDGDCTLVPTGNFCMAAGEIDCSESIRVAALGANNSAVSKTPVAEEGIRCGASTSPCCQQGQCTTDTVRLP